MRSLEGALSFEIFDTILFEQIFNTSCQTVYRFRLGCLHFGNIHGNFSAELDSVIREMCFGIVIMVRRLQKSFGGDATYGDSKENNRVVSITAS